MVRTLSTKDTAKLLRQGLKNEFPGIAFRVTMGRGTAASWLHVHYTDGPTEAALREFVFRYQGQKFNGLTDAYEAIENRVIAFDGTDVPEEIHFQVAGITESRAHSPAAWLFAQAIVDAAGYPEIRVCAADGAPLNDGALPASVVIDGTGYSNLYSPAGLGRSVLSSRDLSGLPRPS